MANPLGSPFLLRNFCRFSRFFNFTLQLSSLSVGSKPIHCKQYNLVRIAFESTALIRQVDLTSSIFFPNWFQNKRWPIPCLSSLSLHDVCRCLMFALQSSFEHSNDSKWISPNFAVRPIPEITSASSHREYSERTLLLPPENNWC